MVENVLRTLVRENGQRLSLRSEPCAVAEENCEEEARGWLLH